MCLCVGVMCKYDYACMSMRVFMYAYVYSHVNVFMYACIYSYIPIFDTHSMYGRVFACMHACLRGDVLLGEIKGKKGYYMWYLSPSCKKTGEERVLESRGRGESLILDRI